MQTQTSTSGTAPAPSLADRVRLIYARNHKPMEEFPLFVAQLQKTVAYVHDNPLDAEKRVYYAHLLKEVGAFPLTVKQCEAALVQMPQDVEVLYSIRLLLQECKRGDLMNLYPELQRADVEKLAEPIGSGVACDVTPGRRYRTATLGEVEFLAAQLNQQTW